MKLLFRLFTIAAVLILTIASCATYHLGQFQYTHRPHYEGRARDIPIWVDEDLGEADKVAIDDAVARWNYALNGHIYLHIVDTHFAMELSKVEKQQQLNGWLFLKIRSDGDIQPPTNNTMAFCDKVGGNRLYLVRDKLSNDKIFGVTLHEIGHLLGSRHNDGGLMFQDYYPILYQCIDYDTVKNVADYQGLSADYLNYCYDKEM